jgi:threonine/homoserine/homoserine lactone efflux protein
VLQRLSPHGNFSAPKAKFLVVAETLSSGFHSGIPVVMAELLCLPLFLSMTYSFAGIFLLLAKITPQKVMFTTSPSEG